MDELTLTALQGSIAKWEAIVAGTGKDDGPLNCPLCAQFHPDYRTDGRIACEGCPISEAGYPGCSNDEYSDFCVSRSDGEAALMHAAAVGELALLKSLLPEVQS
jgi:hypothetical protein